MKPIARSLAILTIVLFSQFGSAAELNAPAQTMPTQVAAAAQDLRMKASPAMTTAVQVAVIDDTRNVGAGTLRDSARPGDNGRTEGLPSTPIALATLLLMICILIGRRNT